MSSAPKAAAWRAVSSAHPSAARSSSASSISRSNGTPSAVPPALLLPGLFVLSGLIALAIGAWLAWQAYSERGIHIEVVFDSAEGIEINKTSVLYKGMTIGVVRDLRLEDDDRRQVVVADIEMNKDVDGYLRSGTRFWLVKPSVTLAGITGLETLVSGNYIGMSPADGEPTKRFVARQISNG